MKPHRPYTLQEYDPKWKERFLAVVEELKPIFGDNLVEIDHIGSTAIPGMLAKPQIDVLIVVKNLDAIKNLYSALSKAGYKTHGREYVVGADDEYITLDGPDGTRLVSVHVFQKGNPKIEECKIFRDYLNNNKTDRELYISTKKNLYSLHKKNYAEYDKGKKEVIAAIKVRAREWADKRV